MQSACLNGVILFLSLPNRWTFYHQLRLDHSGPQNWPTVEGKWPGSIAQCSILAAGGVDRKVDNEEFTCVLKHSKGRCIQLCELNCCKCCTHFTTAVCSWRWNVSQHCAWTAVKGDSKWSCVSRPEDIGKRQIFLFAVLVVVLSMFLQQKYTFGFKFGLLRVLPS